MPSIIEQLKRGSAQEKASGNHTQRHNGGISNGFRDRLLAVGNLIQELRTPTEPISGDLCGDLRDLFLSSQSRGLT